MRIHLAPRRTAAAPWLLLSRFPVTCRGARSATLVLAAAACAATLQACALPAPDTALLKPQPAPRCQLKPESDARKQPGAPSAADAGTDSALVAKLDYERQCYRHAEIIARDRLHKLQTSVQASIRAAVRKDNSSGP